MLLAAWPADVCFRLLRRQLCLADALPPEGFALLLQAVKRRGALYLHLGLAMPTREGATHVFVRLEFFSLRVG